VARGVHQGSGQWAPGLTFCSGLSWPGPGLGCKFNLSSPANGASVGSMVPRDASYEGGCVGAWVCRDGCRDAKGVCVCLATTTTTSSQLAACVRKMVCRRWVMGDRQAHIPIRRTRAHPLHPQPAQFHTSNSNNRGLPSKLGRQAKFAPPPPSHPLSSGRAPHQRQTASPAVTPTRAAAVRDPCLALACPVAALVRPEDETRCLVSLASLRSVPCALLCAMFSMQSSLCSVNAENNCLCLL
jgi:hypothetical protein